MRPVWRFVSFVPLLWGIACAESAQDLSPFPCAADHGCPGGLACVPGIGCTAPELGARCAGACPDALGAACTYGLCVTSCADSSGCGAEQVCVLGAASSEPTSVGRVCLDDCSSGSCPGDLFCADFGNGVRACVASGPVPGDANSKERVQPAK